MISSVNDQPSKFSAVMIVFGDRYRWNFTLRRLECLPLIYSHWEWSAFSPIVRTHLNGEPLNCHDSIRSKAQELIDTFRTMVRNLEATS